MRRRVRAFLLGVAAGAALCWALAPLRDRVPGRGRRRRRPERRRPSPAEGSPAGRKVLVVHDTEEVADYVADVLASSCRVEVAYTGLDGLRKAKSFRPDLLIANTSMPGMGGVELCQRLRDEGEAEGCRMVICSGLHPPPDREAILQAGADDFLQEPFTSGDLFALVGRQLG